MNNTKSLTQQKPRFSVAITTPAYQKLISDTIRDPQRASQFIAAITSAVAVNQALQECEASTVIAGALLGESLRLTPSPQPDFPRSANRPFGRDFAEKLGHAGVVQREELQQPAAERGAVLLHHAAELEQHGGGAKEHADAPPNVGFAFGERRRVGVDGVHALLVDPLHESGEEQSLR